MTAIRHEISALRKGKTLIIDRKNSNRYRLVATESDQSKTAYYFSSPIYNDQTGKAVDMKFHFRDGVISMTGSNAHITIGNSIQMRNTEGSCEISLSGPASFVSETEIVCANKRLRPTTNGVAVHCLCSEGNGCTFSVEISKPFLEIRANDKCFALMSEHFRPFAAFSCIGTLDAAGNVISPAEISYQKISDRKFTISVIPCSRSGHSVVMEANLYEPKLFQDTTVESNHAKSNNAFGGIAFIGSTKEFGEQWLYSRPDFTKIPELNDKKILRAVLHLPKLNAAAVELTASGVAARFCSFGSTWENRISEMSAIGEPQSADCYMDLDLMPILTDRHGMLQRGEGFILKAKKKNAGFSVISTGDSCLFPQILEVTYC